MAKVPEDAPRQTAPSITEADAARRLVLASEALRDDLAPIQPSHGLGRIVLAVVGVALIVAGVAMRHGIGPFGQPPDAASVAFATGGASIALAALPFPYALRAGAALALGLGLMLAGSQGTGPLGGMAADGGLFRDFARLAALSALPGALLFRAQYRAYSRARLVLALALAATVPFLVAETDLLADGAAPTITRAGAALDILAVACSLFGFMGQDTTGASSLWAAVVLTVLSGNIALRELTPLASPDAGTLSYALTSVGTLCAATLASFGIYQLLAAALAGDARRASDKTRAESSPA